MGHAPGVRLIDLLGSMSFAVDLGLGQPMGHVARSAVAASRLGERVGISPTERSTLFHVALMGWVGCIADSRDAATWFGDDIAYRAGVYDLDMAPLPFLGYLLRHAGSGDPMPKQMLKRAGVLLDGGRSAQGSLRAHCQVTAQVARRLSLDDEVCNSLGLIFARWDGKGMPTGVRGTDIPLVVRIWQIADVGEVHYRRGGAAAVVEVAQERRGTQFDPSLVDAFCIDVDPILAGHVDDADLEAMAELEPTLAPALPDARLDIALEAVADWVDLKSPWFTGHSRGVAELAEAAAHRLGMSAERASLVRRAGLLHDLGRTGVSNALWDKASPLTAGEVERTRMCSYYTERMLARSQALSAYAKVAAMAHERLDGSGYHRGLTAAALPLEARLLAAADTFRTKTEPRPHRHALSHEAAATHLLEESRAGRLDPTAVDGVLDAVGQPHDSLRQNPVGLTPREVEVLCHIARGATNREVARRLGISPKTVSNHVERIYAKIRVSTRAGATLFAMEHQLLDHKRLG